MLHNMHKPVFARLSTRMVLCFIHFLFLDLISYVLFVIVCMCLFSFYFYVMFSFVSCVSVKLKHYTVRNAVSKW